VEDVMSSIGLCACTYSTLVCVCVCCWSKRLCCQLMELSNLSHQTSISLAYWPPISLVLHHFSC